MPPPSGNNDVSPNPNPTSLPEIFDYIIDILHDIEDALRNCCLVSKSWVPENTFSPISRFVPKITIDHLREVVERNVSRSFNLSCALHQTLYVGCPHLVTAADAESGGWITSFSSVIHLGAVDREFITEPTASLAPFHGFSPVIKSPRVAFFIITSSRVFNLILSFPLLEDLAVVAYRGYDNDGSDVLSAVVRPSNPPKFTGSLDLFMRRGMKSTARRLLSLPSGIHFQKLTLRLFREEDLLLITALVQGCSSTLESLGVICGPSCTSIRHLRPYV